MLYINIPPIIINCSMTDIIQVQLNLCNHTPEFSDILWHPTKIYGPKVFLLTKIKPEYSDILYNLTHFLGPLVCRIIQILLYISTLIYQICLWLAASMSFTYGKSVVLSWYSVSSINNTAHNYIPEICWKWI